MWPPRIVVAGTVILALMLASVSFMLPSRASINPEFYSDLAATIFLAVLSIGAGVLYLMGLRGFTLAFKKTYYLLCFAFVLQALGSLVYPLSIYITSWANPSSDIIGEIPAVIGAVCIYIGMLQFARLLDVRTNAARPVVVGAILIVLEIIFWFMPHRHIYGGDLSLQLDYALVVVEFVFTVLVISITWRIREVANASYRRSLGWLLAGFATGTLAMVFFRSFVYITYPSWATQALAVIPYALGAFLLLGSGYSFNALSRRPVKQVYTDNATFDSLVYLASLASDPRKVDPILDGLRTVSAGHNSANPSFSPVERQKLRVVYQGLLAYLTTKEPLRSFNSNELQTRLKERFDWTDGALAN